MLQTYSAILKNNQVHWTDEEPVASGEGHALSVLVTIVEETVQPTTENHRQKIAQVLNRLAARNTLAEIDDPVAWQKDLREDRTLPGRD
ncbi:MAG: hypothetical protein JNM09_19970 [Blastocatellia bacterium]|nr:hypothetical protein [Blastocatellia bacterium]